MVFGLDALSPPFWSHPVCGMAQTGTQARCRIIGHWACLPPEQHAEPGQQLSCFV
jgi:hypothetical protein